jgi:hypothetical protein
MIMSRRGTIEKEVSAGRPTHPLLLKSIRTTQIVTRVLMGMLIMAMEIVVSKCSTNSSSISNTMMK